MQREDLLRIRHMVDAVNAASRFVEGRSRADLDSDEMLLFALVRAVEIVGEAARGWRSKHVKRFRMSRGQRLSACGID